MESPPEELLPERLRPQAHVDLGPSNRREGRRHGCRQSCRRRTEESGGLRELREVRIMIILNVKGSLSRHWRDWKGYGSLGLVKRIDTVDRREDKYNRVDAWNACFRREKYLTI